MVVPSRNFAGSEPCLSPCSTGQERPLDVMCDGFVSLRFLDVISLSHEAVPIVRDVS